MLKVDLHIARSFFGPFLVITAAALGLYVMGDALGQLDDFFEEAESIGQLAVRMAWAYLCRLPVFLTPVVPMTVLVSGAFTVAHLARNNEITALKASGVSLYRMLAPIYVCGAIVSLAAFANQELLVPVMERSFLPALEEWTEGQERLHRLGGYLEAEQTRYVVGYNLRDKTLRNPQVVFTRGESITLIDAPRGTWTQEGWLLTGEGGVKVKRTGENPRVLKEYLWRTRLSPARLATDVLPLGSRPFHVILDYIRSGEYTRRHMVIFYERLAYPLAGIALLLAGIPFILNNESVKKSRLVGVGLCIFVGGAYYLVKFISTDLAREGNLPAPAAGFLPVILFGAIGIYLIDRTPT